VKSDEITISTEELVQIIRFGIGADVRQFSASVRRMARRLKRSGSELGDELLQIVAAGGDQAPVMRRASSEGVSPEAKRHSLLYETLEKESPAPALPNHLKESVDRLILEQHERRKLEKAGLAPIRTGLFVGPPGVGKTMTAHWIASKLNRPLYTLNLAATSSSLLGKTGANIREALEIAQSKPSVLLLDEFDSLAKGRNEEDVGEVKRVVTVLLQQIDRWPPHSVLIAATNHGELLDRAIWRRFDLQLDFPHASIETARATARMALAEDDVGGLADLVAELMDGRPLSDIVNVVLTARKKSLLFQDKLDHALLQSIHDIGSPRSRKESQQLALALVRRGHSQRHASELTGVSRDTLRKKLRE